MFFNFSQLFRRFENIIRIGVIAEVNHGRKKLRIKSGGLLTDWIPWPAEIGRNFKRWQPLRVGTQVVLACPSGDPAQAVIVAILYSHVFDAPSKDANIDVVQFNDGTKILYDSDTHQMNIHVEGSMTIHCQDDFSVTAKNIRLN